MAAGQEGPQLESVGRAPAGRLPLLLFGLAAVFIVIALLKPWATASPDLAAPSGLQGRPVATHSPGVAAVPTARAGPAVVYFRQCFPTSTWRLTAIQHNGQLEVRTVWPAAARFDASLPPAGAPRLVGGAVEGIGFCAPGDERSARLAQATAVSLWRRDGSGRIVPVEGARTIDVLLAEEGEVYLAPPTRLAVDGAWPAGDYFFEISPAHPDSSATWLGLQLLAAPAESAPPPTFTGALSRPHR